jgi:hypothetical protein
MAAFRDIEEVDCASSNSSDQNAVFSARSIGIYSFMRVVGLFARQILSTSASMHGDL